METTSALNSQTKFSYTNAESSKNWYVFQNKTLTKQTLLAESRSSCLTPILYTFIWRPWHQQQMLLNLWKYQSTNQYEYPQEAIDGDCASSSSLSCVCVWGGVPPDLWAAPQIYLEVNVFPRWPEGWWTVWGQRSKRVCKGVARCLEEG